MAYDFHYTPTGTGVISGKEVLEQTEDAINDLGNTAISGVQEALDKAEQALTNSENAVDDAQNALNTANNAEGVAIQAQTDVGNLSGTVANIGNRVTTAEGNISNLQGRMTTAEGNITNLQGRMTTAETNIGNLQTAVSTAQATANSAQQTATTARQQSYVFRYSSTAVVPNSTVAYSTIDNTDNIKTGDKILDVDGKLFEITAVDTTNQTVTVGTALIDLALDGNVVHNSGDETVGGQKTFSDNLLIYNSDDTQTPKGLTIRNAQWGMGESGGTTVSNINFLDKNSSIPACVMASKGLYGQSFLRFGVRTKDSQNNTYSEEIYYDIDTSGNVEFRSWHDNIISLGTSAYRWKSVYATNYYYGANNVEFSTKFVTTDTAQTITEIKTFTNTIKSQKEIELTGNRLAYILPEFSASYSGLSLCTYGSSGAVKIGSWKVDDNDNTKHVLDTSLGYLNVATGSVNSVNRMYLTPRNTTDSKLGDSTNKWKEINGLTPSSLSLPSNTGYVDITGYFTNTGDGQTNSYTANANGWIYLNVVATRLIMQIRDSNDNNIYADMRIRSSDGTIYMTIPIGSGNKLLTQWFTSSSVTVTTARFIPCQGNI